MDVFYILVMDKNNKDGEDAWYITKWDNDIEALKMLTSHDDSIVWKISKLSYRETSKCEARLTNTHNGIEEAGHIYEVRKIF